MNLINAFVTRIVSAEPYYTLHGWAIKVEYDCYGNTDTTELLFVTKKEAEAVKIGYEFLI